MPEISREKICGLLKFLPQRGPQSLSCLRARRDHDPALAQPPVFGSCLLWPNGWMDEDATWYGSRPRPRPHCVRRGPSFPATGAQQHPLFSAHVCCGHGSPSQLLPSSCWINYCLGFIVLNKQLLPFNAYQCSIFCVMR